MWIQSRLQRPTARSPFTRSPIVGLMPQILVCFVLLLQAESAAPNPQAPDWTQAAREWMLAYRMAHDSLSPEQTEKLKTKLDELRPEGVRVLLNVYEQVYNVVAPVGEEGRQPADQTQAAIEWIVAYRIVHEGLSAQEAKEYGYELSKMSASQIRVLLSAYREKQRMAARQQKADDETAPSQHQLEAQQRMADAERRLAVEQQRRQLARQTAGSFRAQGDRSLQAANVGGQASATTSEQRLSEMRSFSNRNYFQNKAFSNRMYERASFPYQFRGYGRMW